MFGAELTSDEFARLLQRKVFALTEKYLNPIVKGVARNNPEWDGDTWLEKLKDCVDSGSHQYMDPDKHWDLYYLCVILKKQFLLYKQCLSSPEHEETVDRLNFGFKHLGHSRNLLSHDEISISEIESCIQACVEIVRNFSPPESLRSTVEPRTHTCVHELQEQTLHELERLAKTFEEVSALGPGGEKREVIVESEYYIHLLDKMLGRFESEFRPLLTKAGIKGEKGKRLDTQKIIENLQNLPAPREMTETLRQRTTSTKKAKRIPMSMEDIERIQADKETTNVNILCELLKRGVIDEAKAQDIRAELNQVLWSKLKVLT